MESTESSTTSALPDMAATSLVLRFPPEQEAAFESVSAEARVRLVVSTGLSQLVAVHIGAIGLYFLLTDIPGQVILGTIAIDCMGVLALVIHLGRPPTFVREAIGVGAIICWVVYALTLTFLSRTDSFWPIELGVALQYFLLTTGIQARVPYALVGCALIALTTSIALMVFGTLRIDQLIWTIAVNVVSALYALKSGYELEYRERANYCATLRENHHARQLDVANQRLHDLANTDGLTGLLNRRAMERQIEATLCAKPSWIALFLIDIDHFKLLNDRYGHATGDDALRRVAFCLAQACREMNASVSRWGGEEFVILTAVADPVLGDLLAEHLRAAVMALQVEHDASPSGFVTVSIGYAVCDRTIDCSGDMLLELADNALYTAKRTGRNKVNGLLRPEECDAKRRA